MSGSHARMSFRGNRGQIEVDGLPVPGVQAVTVRAGVDTDAPEVTLDLVLGSGEIDSGEYAHVEVDEGTARVLQALGWSPPPHTP